MIPKDIKEKTPKKFIYFQINLERNKWNDFVEVYKNNLFSLIIIIIIIIMIWIVIHFIIKNLNNYLING